MKRFGLVVVSLVVAALEVTLYVLGADLGALLALVGIVGAWVTYRAQQDSAHRGVLDALDEETRLHAFWLLNEYKVGVWPENAWWTRENLAAAIEKNEQPVLTVNRLATVAVDNAIAQGPALFINPGLVLALSHYRQRLEQFNTLVDNAMALQQSPDLWRTPLDPRLLQHFAYATAWIHWVGIGDQARGGAHSLFVIARGEFESEQRTTVSEWFMWFVFGRTQPRVMRKPLVLSSGLDVKFDVIDAGEGVEEGEEEGDANEPAGRWLGLDNL